MKKRKYGLRETKSGLIAYRDDSCKRDIIGHSHMHSYQEGRFLIDRMERNVIPDDERLHQSAIRLNTSDEIEHMITEKEYERTYGQLPTMEDFKRKRKQRYYNVQKGVVR